MQNSRKIVRFISLFFATALLLSALTKIPWVENRLLVPYSGFLARLSGSILGALGTLVQVQGTTVSRSGIVIEIRHGCDGIEATILLVSALLSYPSRWIRRITGVLSGYGLIFTLNLIRIVGLCLLAFYGTGASFDFFHIYVSQFAVILLTMVFWVYWAAQQKPVDP